MNNIDNVMPDTVTEPHGVVAADLNDSPTPPAIAAAAADPRAAPHAKEKVRIDAAHRRWTDRTPPVQVNMTERRLRSPHSDDSGHLFRLGDTFGSRSGDFLAEQINALDQAYRSCGRRDATDQEVNSALALMAAIAPENELEAALAVQMAQNHAISTELMGRAKGADTLDHMERYANLATKLQRTFTTQIEALARMRGKGQQTVRVEHVTVEAGAQAIVGDVHHHPGAHPHVTTAQPAPTLPSPNPIGDAMPIARDAERPVPHARRRKHRRAEG